MIRYNTREEFCEGQTAIFDPFGLGGLLYWYLLYPVHHFVFQGMLKEIAKASQLRASKNKDNKEKKS